MFQASISMIRLKGCCCSTGTHCWLALSGAHLLVQFFAFGLRPAGLAGGLPDPALPAAAPACQMLPITLLASSTGILLANNAAISCTEGEALPVSSNPNA